MFPHNARSMGIHMSRDQILPLSRRQGLKINLAHDEVIVKWSEFNNTFGKSKDFFEENFPNCLFIRVIRTGPGVKDKSLKPGNIGVVMFGIGHILQAWTYYEECPHFVVREDDILYHGDLDSY